jgi:acetamidase/formamidase
MRLRTKKLTEDEAISLITIGVDFGITKVVDGNWGVHAVIKKDIRTLLHHQTMGP